MDNVALNVRYRIRGINNEMKIINAIGRTCSSWYWSTDSSTKRLIWVAILLTMISFHVDCVYNIILTK